MSAITKTKRDRIPPTVAPTIIHTDLFNAGDGGMVVATLFVVVAAVDAGVYKNMGLLVPTGEPVSDCSLGDGVCAGIGGIDTPGAGCIEDWR